MQTSMTIIIINALDQVKPATPYPALIENKKIKLRVVYMLQCVAVSWFPNNDKVS